MRPAPLYLLRKFFAVLISPDFKKMLLLYDHLAWTKSARRRGFSNNKSADSKLQVRLPATCDASKVPVLHRVFKKICFSVGDLSGQSCLQKEADLRMVVEITGQ